MDAATLAGRSVVGRVVLVVKKKIPTADVDLQLQGTETTNIPRRKEVKREQQAIARARATLKVANGSDNRRTIARGVYNLPFEFVLPVSLPSSTQFPAGGIQYQLRAVIGDLHVDRIFHVVAAPLAPTVVPCICQPTTHELKQAKVLNKGFLSVGACLENSRVGKGQSLKVSVASRNDSSVDIERVRIKLVELIEYKAQGETATLKNELVEVKDVNLPGLVKARSKELRMSKRRFSQSMNSTYQSILQDLVSGANQFEVAVPKFTRDTYDGSLIKISHYLKITYYTKMTVENASTKVPLVIGTPRHSNVQEPERASNEPIATIVTDDPLPPEMLDPSDESTVEVGSIIPMADAIVLDPPPEQNPNRSAPPSGHIAIGAARVFPCEENDGGPGDLPSPMPLPSAPDESLLLESRVPIPPPTSRSHGLRLGSDYNPSHPHSPPSAYSPYAMYSNRSPREHRNGDAGTNSSVAESTAAGSSYVQQPMRNHIDSYSYTDSVSGMTEETGRPQLGHGQEPFRLPGGRNAGSKRLFDLLLLDLRASIHDYEVVAGKVRIADYREFFSSLTPKEYGQIISHCSMAYQVEVANLLARQLVYSSSFTCAHCAEAINKANSYFRTNMVETLVPYCNDLATNQETIQGELSAWELCVTERVFADLR